MSKDNPVKNPDIMLREEFDDWAILFNPDTGDAYGLNPTSVFIWNLLDGKHSVGDIVTTINTELEQVPDEAEDHVKTFIKELEEKGYVAYEINS
ncbi:MAG: SynChlorMet cassette protein ScmD [Pseudomonadota bacterium]